MLYKNEVPTLDQLEGVKGVTPYLYETYCEWLETVIRRYSVLRETPALAWAIYGELVFRADQVPNYEVMTSHYYVGLRLMTHAEARLFQKLHTPMYQWYYDQAKGVTNV